MKKKTGIIIIIITVLAIAAGLFIWGISTGRFFSATFEAEILSIGDNYFLVKPVEGSSELKSSDQITVSMKNMNPSPEPQVGDIIEIRYNGDIMETYPARLGEVYSIRVTQKAPETATEHWALIPMVMVNGELYLDTGFESRMEARCGMMDGEITSTVDGSEKPAKDNQSNFGTDYGYQYGSTEGTIEIYMNDKWWIFATEDVRQELQFPEEENVAGGIEADYVTPCSKDFVEEFLAILVEQKGEELGESFSFDKEHCYNVTPASVAAETDIQIFKFSDSCASYALADGEVFDICSWFGGYGFVNAVPWDYDNDEIMDLLVVSSWGSGIPRSELSVFNAKTKESFVFYNTLESSYGDLFIAEVPASENPADNASGYQIHTAIVDIVDGNFADLYCVSLDNLGTVHVEDGVPVLAVLGE